MITSKAIFCRRYVRKMPFSKRLFPKIGNPFFSGIQQGFFLQLLAKAWRDDVQDFPLVFTHFATNERSAHLGMPTGSFGDTIGIAAFFCCAFFCVRHHFQMWGCFLGSK
ncbi:MAG: hypothetical protein M3Q94_21340 [Pseudomonadota bacterium]|nr:hypothetical protein [Pseudomonadota bacterium]